MTPFGPVFVVIATYNEAQNLRVLADALLAVEPGLRLVIVDDASPDGSGALADEIAARQAGRVTVIHRAGKLGYASAQREGIAAALAAGAHALVTMDADLSHDPATVPALIRRLTGCDVVIGSRYVPGGRIEGWGWFRRFLSGFGGRTVTRLLTGICANDCTSGFRAYRGDILRRIGYETTRAEGYGFLVEILFRCQRAGAIICEEPIVFTDRRAGRSKLSRRIIIESALLCFRLLGERILSRRAARRSGR